MGIKREFFAMRELVCILIVVVVPWLYKFIKTHSTAQQQQQNELSGI